MLCIEATFVEKNFCLVAPSKDIVLDLSNVI